MTDPHTYEALILYLKIFVRELAYYHPALLAPEGAKTVGFDPGSNVDQRDSAVRQWKAYIPDGKLPPPPKRPSP
ncbi:MAG: hypothetical protein AB7K24_20345 [Gemmataceae bacterium]